MSESLATYKLQSARRHSENIHSSICQSCLLCRPTCY